MSPEKISLWLPILTSIWAVVSAGAALLVITSLHQERSQWAARLWTISFAASSLVAAYYFWRLL